jgi:hypothetical protein
MRSITGSSRASASRSRVRSGCAACCKGRLQSLRSSRDFLFHHNAPRPIQNAVTAGAIP